MEREKRKLAYLIWCIQLSGVEIMEALKDGNFDKAIDTLASFIAHATASFDALDESVQDELTTKLAFMPSPFDDETVEEDLLDSCRWLLFLQNWETDSDTTRH